MNLEDIQHPQFQRWAFFFLKNPKRFLSRVLKKNWDTFSEKTVIQKQIKDKPRVSIGERASSEWPWKAFDLFAIDDRTKRIIGVNCTEK